MKRSAVADNLLLNVIRESPGLSLYELHKRLKWSIGKVDGSKDRLLASGKIVAMELNRNGRHVSLIYPKRREAPPGVTLPKSLLHASNPAWKHQSIFYALDSTNIGVTGERFAEWDKLALFKSKMKPLFRGDKVILPFPEQFIRFYDLEHKHYTPSSFDNRVLITVDGDIITKVPETRH